MDGLPHTLALQVTPTIQRTLKAPIGCVGTGLHSGRRVELELRPAPVGTGIVFRRTDLGIDIPARHDHVVDTRLCTVLGLPGRPEARVATVEHIMAALAGAGLHNAIVTLDGPEAPIHDGSSASALFLIDCAGNVAQTEFAPAIEVLRPVRVEQGEAFAELRPYPFGFEMAMSIAFEAAAIGRQALTLRLTPEAFRTELARARTFTLASEIEQMRTAGLALGGSLDNAVVVDGAKVLNPAGLRMPDEFVRHKLLDVVGDLALAGAPLRGRFVGHRTGHALNNRLLRALFSDDANWRLQPASDTLARPDPAMLPAAPSRAAVRVGVAA
jgi:UDP-3-O-[3-hydroxymyristoyl] N-acetylglucosamine deacetylase